MTQGSYVPIRIVDKGQQSWALVYIMFIQNSSLHPFIFCCTIRTLHYFLLGTDDTVMFSKSNFFVHIYILSLFFHLVSIFWGLIFKCILSPWLPLGFLLHEWKRRGSNLNSQRLAQNNPRWDSGIFHTRCVTALRRRGTHGQTCLSTAVLLILVLGARGTASFLSHHLVNWNSLHFLSIPVINQSSIRWLKRMPTTYST